MSKNAICAAAIMQGRLFLVGAIAVVVVALHVPLPGCGHSRRAVKKRGYPKRDNGIVLETPKIVPIWNKKMASEKQKQM